MRNSKQNNIVLIGMPGVGKSTIGVILAKETGREFVDSDLVIQKAEGKLLKDIIAERGQQGFIDTENRINAGLAATNSVIATGGSVVYGAEAMEHLGKIGTIIYIRQSLEELKRRLSNIKNRGVVLRDGQTLDDLYTERCRLYEQYADITVDEEGLDIEQTLSLMMNAIDQ